MNIFQLNYDTRLRSWFDLRANVEPLDTLNKCNEIDKWWQHAPLVNHHLHTMDLTDWPGPWDLLVENTYCYVARALGMCYTLLLTGVTNFEMVEATDTGSEDVILIIVDGTYILNYWPDTVKTNKLSDFTITRSIITSEELAKRL